MHNRFIQFMSGVVISLAMLPSSFASENKAITFTKKAWTAVTELPVDFHASGQATYTRVKANGESLSPVLFQFKAEAEFTDTFMDGIGLQGVYGIPISDATKNDLTLEITKQTAAYITLTNPLHEPGDLKVSILLGYASTKIDTQLSSLTTSNSDTFSGFSFGFSLQDRILESKPYNWTLDCARYFKDNYLSIDGCGLGVTYDF